MADLAYLSSLNLRNADGSNFDPQSDPQLHDWLLAATAQQALEQAFDNAKQPDVGAAVAHDLPDARVLIR